MNPPFFFCVFLSPFVRSCSRIGFAKFFRRNTTPLRVWRFPRNPSGHETLPFQFAFYLCRWNNQTSGDRKTKCGGSRNGFVHAGYSRPPSSRKRTKQNGIRGYSQWRQLNRLYGLSVRKRQPTKTDEKKKSAVPTCDTECPCGFQFVSEDSRFRSSADSRVCLMALSVKLHRQGYKT